MTGYGPFDGVTLTALMIAVALSVLVRRLGLSTRRERVKQGEATAEDLAELSGIRQRADLQAAFGPPGIDRIWRHVTLADIKAKRTDEARFFVGGLFDYASLAGILLPLLIRHPLVSLGALMAAGLQAMAWIRTRRPLR
jgi:hypothetical protein